MPLEMHFLNDLFETSRHQLLHLGCPAGKVPSGPMALEAYRNVAHRLIEPKPRNIQRARSFSCPNELRNGLKLVEDKIVNGKDLRVHLSRQLMDPTYNDMMLNDWGIYHLHLGTIIEADGFIKRTGLLLFARVVDQSVYFVGVARHGEWTDQQILETINENWPETLSAFKLPDASAVSMSYSDKDIQTLRKVSVSMIHQLSDGTILMPPGGAYSTSGLSITVQQKADRFRKHVQTLELKFGYKVSHVL
jgi:hypothetical protein